ncbi:MAG: TIGR01459 family HAD-type hydrolase [Hyphomicrobiaceae bacterium]
MITTPLPPPPIIESADALLARYDVVFCDVWGVVHDGRTAYVAGCAALARFRRRGGTVVLLTNAPRAADAVARILAEKHVPEEAWDAIVSSGEITRAHVADAGYQAVHHIGPDRDLDLFEAIAARRVPLAEADALIATGLVDDRRETGEHYRAPLAPALDRGLELVCANPDLVVDVGGTMLPCAGAIATVYEAMGGPVYWAGKPHRPAYEMARACAQELRQAEVALDRILAIGDAVRTDLAGASNFGIDSLFIGQGIHRDEVLGADRRFRRDRLARLLSADAPRPVAAMVGLA